MENKNAIELMEGRRTYRRFDESLKIPDGVVEKIQYSARLASSAMNRQPLKYIYVRDPETVNKIFDITGWGGFLPPEQGRPKIGERPTMFTAVLADKCIPSRFAPFDAGLAVSNMTLAAYECGVGSCIIGSAGIDELKTMLDISDDLEVVVLVAFGYPTHESRVVDMNDGDIKYYLDENRNYVIPKRKTEDTVREI